MTTGTVTTATVNAVAALDTGAKADASDPAFNAAPQVAAPPAQQVAVNSSDADALPASQPLSGPIPLPRRRPHSFAMVQAGAPPLPRTRPPAAPEATPTPSNDAPFARDRDYPITEH
jgi:hypothetical protein